MKKVKNLLMAGLLGLSLSLTPVKGLANVVIHKPNGDIIKVEEEVIEEEIVEEEVVEEEVVEEEVVEEEITEEEAITEDVLEDVVEEEVVKAKESEENISLDIIDAIEEEGTEEVIEKEVISVDINEEENDVFKDSHLIIEEITDNFSDYFEFKYDVNDYEGELLSGLEEVFFDDMLFEIIDDNREITSVIHSGKIGYNLPGNPFGAKSVIKGEKGYLLLQEGLLSNYYEYKLNEELSSEELGFYDFEMNESIKIDYSEITSKSNLEAQLDLIAKDFGIEWNLDSLSDNHFKDNNDIYTVYGTQNGKVYKIVISALEEEVVEVEEIEEEDIYVPEEDEEVTEETVYIPYVATKDAEDIDVNEGIKEEVILKNHTKYIYGYKDGEVKANNNITREEVAAILFRVTNFRAAEGKMFNDVEEGKWSTEAINTLSANGVINGYEDNTFRGQEYITRAESAAMLARLNGLKSNTNSTFEDVSSEHWASKEIAALEGQDWIKGYGDGTFRPDEQIKRNEFVVIVNQMLNRVPTEVNDSLNPFSDLNENTWDYKDMMEASVDHDYNAAAEGHVWIMD